MSDKDKNQDVVYSEKNKAINEKHEKDAQYLLAVYYYCESHDDIAIAIWLPNTVDGRDFDYVFNCTGSTPTSCAAVFRGYRVYQYQGDYHPLKKVYDGFDKNSFDRDAGGYPYEALPAPREIKQYIPHREFGVVNSITKKFPPAYKWDMDKLGKLLHGKNILKSIEESQ